jgi:hypothetical protein
MSGLMVFTTGITQSGNQQHGQSPVNKKTGKWQPSSGFICCSSYIAIFNTRVAAQAGDSPVRAT